MTTASGISEVDFNEKIHYPNPASDLLTIAIDGMKSIYISNLKGEIFKKIQTGTTTISLSELPAGNYLIKVFSEYNEFISSALIIRRN